MTAVLTATGAYADGVLPTCAASPRFGDATVSTVDEVLDGGDARKSLTGSREAARPKPGRAHALKAYGPARTPISSDPQDQVSRANTAIRPFRIDIYACD